MESLRAFNQEPARHHRFLLDELRRALEPGGPDRLMVFMPPNSAKTTYASVIFPAWFMAQAPNQHLICASHGGRYAEDLSAQTIRLIAQHAETLGYAPISTAADLWRTSNGCTYRSAGSGGSITGRRADLFLIDDPIKGREDADSEVIREKVWKWYRGDVLSRLNPGGRIILIQTRWHEDDLAGRLLNEMHTGAGDTWRVINLPAIAEANDLLGREPGEALWPERFSAELLERVRHAVGPREWSALYQQRPTPLEGAIFKPGMMPVLDAAPVDHSDIIRAWDLAATAPKNAANPAYTVGIKLARMPNGAYVIHDVIRHRGGPDEIRQLILNVARIDGQKVPVKLPQDPGQAGVVQVLDLTRVLAGYTVQSERETGDKATRASPVASQVNVGNVAMVRGAWNQAFKDELAAFPSGLHDDQVDALSSAFAVVGVQPMLNIDPAMLIRLGINVPPDLMR